MEPSDDICVYCSRSTSSRGRRMNNVLLSALHTIERYAVQDQGVVGSIYDARTDTILSPLKTTKNLLIHEDVHEYPASKLIKVDDPNGIDLLHAININGDLRVSIALGIQQITAGTLLSSTLDLLPNRMIRCIDYYHVDQKVSLSTDMHVARNTFPNILPAISGTHIVTSVSRGIDFILVLEFARNERLEEIDGICERLSEYFMDAKAKPLPMMDQEKFLDLTVTIFSQSSHLRSFTEKKNLNDICQSIAKYIHSDRDSVALSYILHPVKCIYYDSAHGSMSFNQLDSSIVQKIERKILPLSSKLRAINRLFFQGVSSRLSEKLPTRINETHNTIRRVEDIFKTMQHTLATIVTDYRCGKLDVSKLNAVLNNAQMDAKLHDIHSTLLELQSKARLITQLQADYHIDYFNVADWEDSADNLESLKGKLYSLDQQQQHGCYLCSSTALVEKDREQHKKLCQQLIQLCSSNPSFRPVFADFSYCSRPLTDMQIFQPSAARSEEINILLVGETGVGKSTFINAFVNYLVYQSLSEAENGEPVVLIPTSFLITTGDQFQEKKIDLGELDANEDHNHSGQSVTQHCRSYIFHLGNDVKLRIIDTPGVGDTRGMAQDIRNIDHIVSYITSLSHLNAVCFLLKPNTARLHALFRLCFTQLFDFLAPDVRENIIFSFTNTRATFYAPGDTLPSLKAMINELPENRRPLVNKSNTFCFDSESFRYLAVVKAGAKSLFDDEQRSDFANSWKLSMNESIRLLTYIQRRPKYAMIEYRSIRHAQMMITWLARPIVEAIRIALRNLIIADKRFLIEIKVQPKLQPADPCTSNTSQLLEVRDFWIMEYLPNQHRTLNEDLPVFYELQCWLEDRKDIVSLSSTGKMKERLLSASLVMTQFLLQTERPNPNPFLSWFNLLLQEESSIHAQHPSSVANEKLCQSLYQAKEKYERDINGNQFTRARVNLNDIYECIEEVLSYAMVSKQFDAIRESQMALMKHNERDVSLQYPHISMDRMMTRFTMMDPRN